MASGTLLSRKYLFSCPSNNMASNPCKLPHQWNNRLAFPPSPSSRLPKINAVQVDIATKDLFDETQEKLAALVRKEPRLRERAAAKLLELAEELATEQERGEQHLGHLHPPLQKIKKGFAAFKRNNYLKRPHVYEPLKTAQYPKLMVISCSDSRVCPTHILGLDAGDAFVVRNVANLVPPYEEDSLIGTSAALEYGVLFLKVDHILVIGHSLCGGINALMSLPDDVPKSTQFIQDWIKIGKPARDAVKTHYGSCSLEQQCQHCEKESVRMSLSNLLTFPFVKDSVSQGKLSLHGGYYDFIEGSFHHWALDSSMKLKAAEIWA